jgi:chloramphenicol-sensitive protein RarD
MVRVAEISSVSPLAELKPREQPSSQAGLGYGLAAYALWGFIPLYFRALSEVPPIIILCHRIFWSALFLAAVVSFKGEWKSIGPILRNGRNVGLLAAGAVLIALNWLLFIYAVSTRQVLQASLGYFMNPLLSIALALVFLGERLRRAQWLAVLIAGVAILNLGLRSNSFPWLALALAGSFGFYGLVRKHVDVNSLHALFVETILLLLPALLLILFVPSVRVAPASLAKLSLSGIVTAVPLIFFGAAVRRLKLSTMGFLQYVSPSLQFLVALVLFHEALDVSKLISFGLCWLALAVYSADSLLARQPQPVIDEAA